MGQQIIQANVIRKDNQVIVRVKLTKGYSLNILYDLEHMKGAKKLDKEVVEYDLKELVKG